VDGSCNARLSRHAVVRPTKAAFRGSQDIEQESRVLNGEGICIEGVKPEVLPRPSVRREAAAFPGKTP
jgi:hypothetical protein